MSGPPPGRQRSLGASLLDQVLAETVDPAYRQATEARAARRAHAAASGEPPAPRPWLRRNRGQLLVAFTLLLTGLLAAITYREAAAGAQGREEARQALREDVVEETEANAELVAQLEDLTARVASTRQDALARSVVGQRALEQLAAAEQGAAVQPVSGPGVRVTLGNAPPAADSDPVGGSDQVALAGIVQDGDLQLAVNALWAAGAEAISIDGQRIGATTAIRQAGDAILVDFRPVLSPYEIEAIGDSEDLARRFVTSPESTTLGGLTKNFGVVFDYARVDDLDLPAGTSAELGHAEPLAEDPTTDPPTDGG
ncbi:DUF881 domain-containing protein [Modestobacter italicus]|uniref:DUF881 domain-containing protein n=1 Tax=Modestobacter italicus (strain DSM 44449 / CECT 9708 / BC 501) TaxID=2732864 RepID=UPI001C95E87D|nr:DUF881 domain-containing protein [Modestobacter italicus]